MPNVRFSNSDILHCKWYGYILAEEMVKSLITSIRKKNIFIPNYI